MSTHKVNNNGFTMKLIFAENSNFYKIFSVTVVISIFVCYIYDLYKNNF